jgi:L-ascorbate metabolism protein UlaG (beta-lactamase superfamily)
MAWLGHATVLINMYGVRILTDPVLFRRIGIDVGVGTLGPLRLVNLLLVSHAHFDHLDTPSLAAVPGMPAVVMASKTSDLLPGRPYASVRELQWNESAVVRTRRGDVHVRAVEVRHWGARIRRDRWRGWTGFVLEREGSRLLIGGDTAVTPLFAGYRALGPFDAAVMPVGAYDPWIWNHCTPEQAVQMADAAGARLIVPVHHRSFQLSNEGFDEPIERVQEALHREPERIAVKDIGETTTLRI